MKPLLPCLAVACLALGACGGEESSPPPVQAPPPPTAGSTFDVNPCLTQSVPGGGPTVALLVVPDTLTLDLSRPASFPNGRALPDPVIDRTLAMLFLSLSKESIDRFHRIPLGPPSNDRPFRTSFPWLAPPQGSPPLDPGTGSGFSFREDPLQAFVRVDRTGMPALATALIPGPQRNEYNDDSPGDDLSTAANGEFKWVPALRNSLVELTVALADDLRSAGVTMCAIPA